MNLNKDIGYWAEDNKYDIKSDVMYYLYVNWCIKNHNKSYGISDQVFFIEFLNENGNKKIYEEYSKKAEKYIRKEKIKKIKDENN